MDYDMMASPNFAYQIYNATNALNPEGSEELRDLYIEWYKSQSLNYTFIPFDGRSDYDGFIRNGIPGGGIATGAEGIKTKKEAKMFGGKAGDWYDPCYHQLCDDVGNVNVTSWVVNTKVRLFCVVMVLCLQFFSSLPTPLRPMPSRSRVSLSALSRLKPLHTRRTSSTMAPNSSSEVSKPRGRYIFAGVVRLIF
jgi:Zn-dependent M28 family amino/carboxypeptidase